MDIMKIECLSSMNTKKTATFSSIVGAIRIAAIFVVLHLYAGLNQ
jgi:hypothetical protein